MEERAEPLRGHYSFVAKCNDVEWEMVSKEKELEEFSLETPWRREVDHGGDIIVLLSSAMMWIGRFSLRA